MFTKLRLVLSVFAMMATMASACYASQPKTLRLALLAIPDVLPAYVAEDLGLFESAGIEVELLRVSSGMERDQLMQAGRVDGMLNELVSTANFNRKETSVQVVALSRKTVGDIPLFRLLASPKSDIKTSADLLGRSVVISKNTVIDYITEKMLLNKGIPADKQKTQSVPSLPERYQLLLMGNVDAVTLPEPLASSAMAAGAIDIVNDTAVPNQSLSVLSFSQKSIVEKRNEIALFVAAWEKAASAINKNPEQYLDVMQKNIRIPGNVKDSYKIPPYVVGELPSKELWADTMEWMIARGLLTKALPYDESISQDFVGLKK